VKKRIETGEDALLSGFGKLSVREKNERRGRNPATCEEKVFDSRMVVTFR